MCVNGVVRDVCLPLVIYNKASVCAFAPRLTEPPVLLGAAELIWHGSAVIDDVVATSFEFDCHDSDLTIEAVELNNS